MNVKHALAAFAAGALIVGASAACADPSSASTDWGSDTGFHSSAQQSASTDAMTLQLLEKEGKTSYNVTNNDYGNSYSTSNYNGPVTSLNSGATNLINSSSNLLNTYRSSGATITISTGQVSGTARQGATATTTDHGESVTTTATSTH